MEKLNQKQKLANLLQDDKFVKLLETFLNENELSDYDVKSIRFIKRKTGTGFIEHFNTRQCPEGTRPILQCNPKTGVCTIACI